ncbi:MAG TPA: VanZ family protein [Pyrinomonadaceae bacterium]
MLNKQNKLWRGRFFRYAPLILWIGVIFIASSNTGSMSNTSRIIRPLLEFLFPNTPEEILVVYHGYIRKCAHFAEYFGLAFFAARAFSGSSNKTLRKFWFIFAMVLIAIVATADETNQSFLASRTSSVYDVLLDCSGGLTMILLFALIRKYLKGRNASSNERIKDLRLKSLD